MCLGAMSGGVRDARWTQIGAIARADVPWSDVWRGSRRSMDTNQCHRASEYALEAPRMAIAMPDELQESVGPGTVRPCVAVRRPSGKSSRGRMCLRAMSGGVRGARWTQIGAIARANMPCRPVEWRLPCQMNCRKGGQRPCTAVCGRSESFRQIIARADVP